jgi:hypothetical protein
VRRGRPPVNEKGPDLPVMAGPEPAIYARAARCLPEAKVSSARIAACCSPAIRATTAECPAPLSRHVIARGEATKRSRAADAHITIHSRTCRTSARAAVVCSQLASKVLTQMQADERGCTQIRMTRTGGLWAATGNCSA